jgi:heme A synthase
LNTLITQPTRAAAGVIAVLIGTPAFYAWRAGSRRRALALPTAPEL